MMMVNLIILMNKNKNIFLKMTHKLALYIKQVFKKEIRTSFAVSINSPLKNCSVLP